MAAFVVSVGVTRAATSEIVAVKFASFSEETFLEGVRPALGVALCIGAIASVAIAVGSVAVTNNHADVEAALILAACMPLITLQDTFRFCFVVQRRPRRAFANDLVWAIAQLGAVVGIVAIRDHPPLWELVAAWGLSACLAAGLGVAQLGLMPRPGLGSRWLREHRDLLLPFLTEFFAGQGAYQVALFVVGAVAGLSGTGAVRGVQTLFGPLVVVSAGMTMATIPELARIADTGAAALRSACVKLGLGLALVSLATGAVLLAVPDRLGQDLLGQSWQLAKPLIILATVQKVGEGLSIGAFAGLRALRLARRTASLRTAIGASLLIAALVGGHVDGARGFMVGASVIFPAASLVWWVLLARATGGGWNVRRAVRPNAGRWLRRVAVAVTLGVVSVCGGFALIREPRDSLLCAALVLAVWTIGACRRWSTGSREISTALLFLALVTSTWNALRIHGLTVSDGFLALALAVAVVGGLDRGTTLAFPKAGLVAGGGLVAAVALAAMFPRSVAYMAGRTTANSISQGYSVAAGVASTNAGNLAKFEIGVVALPFLIAFVARDLRLIRAFAYAWAASAVVDALVALADHYGLLHLASFVPGTEAGSRESGLTIQPNHLALSCALAIPILMYLCTRVQRLRPFAVAGIALLLVAIVLSGSRGGAVAAALALVLTSLVLPQARRLIPRLVVGAVLFGIVAISELDRWIAALAVRTRLVASNTLASDAARSALGHQAILDTKTSPLFGVGFGQLDQAHDIYLGLLAGGGILTLAAFLLFVLSGLRVAVRLPADGGADLARVLAVSVAVWLSAGLVENAIIDRYLYVPIALLFALWAVQRRQAEAVRSLEAAPGRVDWVASAAPRSERWTAPA